VWPAQENIQHTPSIKANGCAKVTKVICSLWPLWDCRPSRRAHTSRSSKVLERLARTQRAVFYACKVLCRAELFQEVWQGRLPARPPGCSTRVSPPEWFAHKREKDTTKELSERVRLLLLYWWRGTHTLGVFVPISRVFPQEESSESFFTPPVDGQRRKFMPFLLAFAANEVAVTRPERERETPKCANAIN